MVEYVTCENLECEHNKDGECNAEEIVIIKEGVCITDSQYDS